MRYKVREKVFLKSMQGCQIYVWFLFTVIYLESISEQKHKTFQFFNDFEDLRRNGLRPKRD